MGAIFNQRSMLLCKRGNSSLCVLFILIILLWYMTYVTISSELSLKQRTDNSNDSSVMNMLDGCYHVYLDVGSNIGVQVRKLYEPEKYPKAPFLKLFDKYFGSLSKRRQHQPQMADTVCAVGFEPNPHHTKILRGTYVRTIVHHYRYST